MRSSRARRLRWLALPAALLALEGGWRAYLAWLATPERQGKYLTLAAMPERALRYRPHPELGYALNERFASADGRNRHSSRGTRGAEFAVPKPAGVVRIACVGGSSTYETGVPADADVTSAVMERALRGRLGLPDVEVIDAGVPGYASWEIARWVEASVLEWEPDLVLYCENTNDVHPRLVRPELYRADQSGYRKPWDAESPWWDASLVVRWLGVQTGFSPRNDLVPRTTRPENRADDPMAALDANPPVHLVANVRGLIRAARARGVEVAIASWPWCPEKGDLASTPHYQRGFRENEAVLRDLAREEGVPWLELRERMPTDPALWHDGAHVNTEGARVKGEILAELVAGWLAGREAGGEPR